MDDWLKGETIDLVREAVAQDPRVEKAQTGPRSNEMTLTLKDGSLRVVAMAVRDAV